MNKYYVRACVDQAGDVISTDHARDFNELLADAVVRAKSGVGFSVFWTLYERQPDGTSLAVEDFEHLHAAMDALAAIQEAEQ